MVAGRQSRSPRARRSRPATATAGTSRLDATRLVAVVGRAATRGVGSPITASAAKQVCALLSVPFTPACRGTAKPVSDQRAALRSAAVWAATRQRPGPGAPSGRCPFGASSSGACSSATAFAARSRTLPSLRGSYGGPVPSVSGHRPPRPTWNENPRPDVWTKTAEEIVVSIKCYCQRIKQARH
jgi:hypothetical protein